MEVMKPKEFCKRIGISIKTLERIEKRGEITPIWKNKRRYYTDDMVDSYLGIRAEEDDKRINIAYYRVSTNGQKKEMKYQRESIESFSINSGTPIDEYFHDIGSGMNFKRKNFLKIIDMIEKGEVRELVITYKDRLTRFGFDLIQDRCDKNHTKLTVINLEKSSPEKEMVEDLMTIIHVFSCRLYGLRKYKNKLKKDDLYDTDSED